MTANLAPYIFLIIGLAALIGGGVLVWLRNRKTTTPAIVSAATPIAEPSSVSEKVAQIDAQMAALAAHRQQLLDAQTALDVLLSAHG